MGDYLLQDKSGTMILTMWCIECDEMWKENESESSAFFMLSTMSRRRPPYVAMLCWQHARRAKHDADNHKIARQIRKTYSTCIPGYCNCLVHA